jgi:hypothetical protein
MKPLRLAHTVLFLAVPLFAQQESAVSLTIRFVDGTSHFHTGEVIPIELSFKAPAPGMCDIEMRNYDRNDGRPVGTRTPDLYRVKNEIKSLNPLGCLTLPGLTPSTKAPICPSFADELVTSFCPCSAHASRDVAQYALLPGLVRIQNDSGIREINEDAGKNTRWKESVFGT